MIISYFLSESQPYNDSEVGIEHATLTDGEQTLSAWASTPQAERFIDRITRQGTR